MILTNYDDKGTQPPTSCNGCKKDSDYYISPITDHHWSRTDYNGFFTGVYCDKCYNSNDTSKYPYRKDNYNYDALLEGEDIWGDEQ